MLKQSDVQRRLEASGAMAVGSTPEEFGAMLRREQALYAKLLREIGLAGKSQLYAVSLHNLLRKARCSMIDRWQIEAPDA